MRRPDHLSASTKCLVVVAAMLSAPLVAGCSTGDAAGPAAGVANPPPGTGDPSSLLYEQNQYFEGLEEWILIHKGPDGSYCQRADGRRQDCEEVKVEDRLAAYKKWGAMVKAFGIKVLAADPEQVFEAHVDFHVPEPADLASTDASIRKTAQEKFFADVLAKDAELRAWVSSQGGTILAPSVQSMPEFTMRGPAKLYKAMAWMPAYSLIREYIKSSDYGHTDVGPTDSISVSHVDTSFNASGYYGRGQKVGILSVAGGCQLFAAHESLAHATVIEYPDSTGKDCSTASDCPCNLGVNAACHNGKCVDDHESQVASIIAAGRSDSQYGASQVTIYHYNGVGYDSVVSGCDPVTSRAAYEYFRGQEVHVVNESFICFNPDKGPNSLASAASVDGYVQDYYARKHNMLIARAAGNDALREAAGVGPAPACPYIQNGLCVGGVDSAGQLMCRGNHSNPLGTDREEPDILAVSGNSPVCPSSGAPDGVDVAKVPHPSSGGSIPTDQWTRSNGGTSFAAPQIAQFAILQRQQCGSSSIGQRSYFMAVADVVNADQTGYSTPATGNFRDGAGVTDGPSLLTGTCSNTTEGPFDLTDGGPAPFESKCVDCGQPLAAKIHPLAVGSDFDPNGDRWYRKILMIDSAVKRLRAVFSWDACAEIAADHAPVPITTDFDLWLTNEDTKTAVYASQSNNDNNEGFDADLSRWGVGNYAVWVSWPKSSRGCELTKKERTAFSHAVYY